MVAGQPNERLADELQVMKNSEPTPFLRSLGQRFVDACKKQKPGFVILSYYEKRESGTIQVDAFLSLMGPC